LKSLEESIRKISEDLQTHWFNMPQQAPGGPPPEQTDTKLSPIVEVE
jgi:hypothetical protein